MHRRLSSDSRTQRQAGERVAARASTVAALAELWWATPVLPEDYLECLQQLHDWQPEPADRGALLAAELQRLRSRTDALAAEGLPQSPLRLARHQAVVGRVAHWAAEPQIAVTVLAESVRKLAEYLGAQHRFTQSARATLTAARR